MKVAFEEQHPTPGAVSRQVRALELRLDVQLNNRSGGRYEVTPLGELLIKQHTRCFDDLERAESPTFRLPESGLSRTRRVDDETEKSPRDNVMPCSRTPTSASC